MSTAANILDLMGMLDRELQTGSAEPDEARALTAANAAQDYFESLIALQPELMGDEAGTITTTADTETTPWPTGLLRLDKLQYLDPTVLRPAWNLERISQVGGHSGTSRWHNRFLDSVTTLRDKPQAYWTDGTNIYWDPLPDAVHTVRWYGLLAQPDLTDRTDVIGYPDIALLPLASMATKLIKIGKEDQHADLGELAVQTFDPVIQTLARFNRDRPRAYNYSRLNTA